MLGNISSWTAWAIIQTTHKTTHAMSRGTWSNLPGSLPFMWRGAWVRG